MYLQLQHLTRSYGKKVALYPIDLRIRPGERICLLGANGSGKTTLLHLLLGLIRPSDGTITYDGKIHRHLPQSVLRRIGYAGLHDRLPDVLTVVQYLRLSAGLYGLKAATTQDRIQQWLEYFFPAEMQAVPVRQLSAGMQQLVSVGAAILHAPDLLLLDEPFAHLDPVIAARLQGFLRSYAQPHRCWLIASHQLEYVQSLCDRVLVLAEGKIVFSGSMEQLLNEHPDIWSAYRNLMPAQRSTSFKWVW